MSIVVVNAVMLTALSIANGYMGTLGVNQYAKNFNWFTCGWCASAALCILMF